MLPGPAADAQLPSAQFPGYIEDVQHAVDQILRMLCKLYAATHA